MDVLACDIQEAYLTADCRDQVWVVVRPEFVSNSINNILVINYLYELKTYGEAFRAFLAEIHISVYY